ncbi:hypothetical protein [Roseospira navarrensis]|uniref:Uncharacterized protein n=1 Tax=Roseospira navarrensis TaxID=140058 RepID=A0A7X1ZF47_9PROT|nr:hypothetical protein [Roseospira navarrensis]MQX37346.1 hypothetical protein [Roseospira navarrensis]
MTNAHDPWHPIEPKDLHPVGDGLSLLWHPGRLLQWVARSVQDGAAVLVPLGAAWPDDRPATLDEVAARLRIQERRQTLQVGGALGTEVYASPFDRPGGCDPLAA